MEQEPDIRNIPLHFYLGEYRVLSPVLRLVTVPFSFDATPLDARTWPEIPDAANIDGIYLPSARIAPELPVISTNNGLIRYVRATYRRHYIDLDGTMEGYEATFSGKTRSTLRRKVRKFAEADGGTLDFRKYTTPAGMEEFFHLARKVSASTYQERLLDAGLPDSDEFLARMKALAGADRVRAYILFLDGEPVSYLYLPAEGDRLIYAYLGYLPEHGKLSPGTVLQHVALDDIFAEGRFKIFDFTEGQGAHKELFGTNHISCGDVLVLRKTLRNHLLVRAHRAWSVTMDGLTGLLDRIGVKAMLKRWIRRSA